MAKPNRNKGVEVEKTWTAKNTKYKQEYCQDIIDNGKKGHSFAQFNSVLGVSRRTFDNWTEAHKEFGEAKLIAQEHCKAYWDKQVEAYAVESPEGDKLNTSHLKYIASERFPLRQALKLRQNGNVAMCFEDVAEAVSTGKISVDDGNKYATLFLGMAQAQQHEQLVREVEELKAFAAQIKSQRFGNVEGGFETPDSTRGGDC